MNHPPLPNLVAVLSPRQNKILQGLIIFWVINLAFFWYWWLRSDHYITFWGLLINSLLLGYTTLLPLYFFYFTLQMKRPNPRIPIPSHWRVAMVVTKAPSEPWDVVQTTLEAMLEQKFPHDTWLADEDPDDRTRSWCKARGVKISSRKGVASYHRPQWPRRTRCKEGNLAYFYDQVGYEHYDLVVQLDADHVPTPGYLEAMIRPFVDPDVGYVAAPSICDANVKQSWVVKSRLFAEATLHGALQAGYNNGWAPLCIGSHYAVRTAALQQIGGLGPELAEDHTTTLMMNAAGWKGVFALDADAHGLGPSSFPDCMTQEFQWSRSLMKVLLTITPRYLGALPPRLQFQFLFAQLFYPVFGLCSVSGILLPVLALIIDVPWVRVFYWEFLLRITLLSLTTVLPVLWLRRCGCLRPIRSKILSWEIILFQIARGPWILAGIGGAIASCVVGRELAFKITPKEDRASPLPLKVILPYLFLGCGACGAVLLIGSVRYTAGYYFLALLNASILIGLAAIVLILHHCQTRLFFLKHRSQYGAVGLGLVLLLVTGTERLLLLWSVFNPVSSSQVCAQISVPRSPESIESPVNNVAPVMYGVYDPKNDFKNDPAVTLDHHFVFWRLNNTRELETALHQAKTQGRSPLITLEPFAWNWNQMTTTTLLNDIVAGRYDSTIQQIFKVLRAYPSPVYFRFGHEMEVVGEYPWSKGDGPAFIAAYRHVHQLAQRQGVTNVIWVWSPAGFLEAKDYWPGKEYVDLIGVSIYATKEWSKDGNIPSFEQLMRDKYWFSQVYGKPMMAAEVGVSGSESEKKQWLAAAIASLKQFPQLRGWVYFNQRQPDLVPLEIGQKDWSLNPAEVQVLEKSWELKAAWFKNRDF